MDSDSLSVIFHSFLVKWLVFFSLQDIFGTFVPKGILLFESINAYAVLHNLTDGEYSELIAMDTWPLLDL